REAGGVDDETPPTIEALLAARLDLLKTPERELAERAALIGRDFDIASVRELVAERVRVKLVSHLDALVVKELIGFTRAADGRTGYRFRHILIRDAVYRGMAKQRRAELHDRFADW